LEEVLVEPMLNKSIKEIMLVGGTNVIVLILGLLINIVWTRIYPVEVFGTYQLIVSILSFLSVFAYSGLSQSLSMSAAKKKFGNFSIIYKERFKLGIYITPILWLISLYYYTNSKSEIATILLISSLVFPVYVNQTNWDHWLTGMKSYKDYSLYKISSIVLVLLSIVFVKYINIGEYSVLAVIFLTIVIYSFVNFKIYMKNNKNNKTSDRGMVNYGKVITGALLFNSILLLDKFYIGEVLGVSGVAFYAIIMIFPGLIRTVIGISNKILIPRFSEKNTVNEVVQWFFYKFIIMYIGFILLGLLGFIFIEDVVNFIFTDEYHLVSVYAKWMFLIGACTYPLSYFSNILIYQNKIIYVYILSFSTVFSKVVPFLFLVPEYGLWGVVYANIINMVFVAIIIIVSTYYYTNIKTL
jgi:O-antigen/teichoic acid export membrane protein